MIPLLFLKIDFKYSLLLITVQPQNELNEQVRWDVLKGVLLSSGHLELKIKQKRNNLSLTASAHATAITGT